MNRSKIPISEPCCESWGEMAGNRRSRFCDVCEKDVVNLSTMTKAEAREFVRNTPNPCVRFTHDSRGMVYFVPVQLQRQRQGLKRLLAAALMIPMSCALASCDEYEEVEEAAAVAPSIEQVNVDSYEASASAEQTPLINNQGSVKLRPLDEEVDPVDGDGKWGDELGMLGQLDMDLALIELSTEEELAEKEKLEELLNP